MKNQLIHSIGKVERCLKILGGKKNLCINLCKKETKNLDKIKIKMMRRWMKKNR